LEAIHHLAEETTREVNQKITLGHIKGKYAAKYGKPVSPVEILHVVGMNWALRNDQNIPRISDIVKVRGGKFPLSSKRFSIIVSNLRCNWEKLKEILTSAWKRNIIPGSAVVVDEFLLGYHSTEPDCPK